MTPEAADATAPDVVEAPPRGRPVLHHTLFLLVAFGLAVFFRLHQGGGTDNDSFYHLRHAAIYAQRGLFAHDFPWLQDSILRTYASDIGYGFHVFLMPFARAADPITGIQWGAIVETVLVLLLIYGVGLRHRLAYPGAWPFVLLFLGAPILYTFLLTRPQTLTMGFAALLLSSMIVGRPWVALLSAFAIGFTHLNIALVIVPIIGIAFVVRGLVEKRWDFPRLLYAMGGALLGWVLRPNPIGALKLEYVQTVVHTLVRQKGLPLLFGAEWQPLALDQAFTYFGLFAFLWLGLAAFVVAGAIIRQLEGTPATRTLLWSSLFLSLLFFALAVGNTRRGTPLWASFAVIFCAAAFTCLANWRKHEPGQYLSAETRMVLGLGVLIVFGLMVKDCVEQHVFKGGWGGGDSYRMQPAAQWIADHSQPGEIVYNVDWGMFPELFCWNPKNHYVQGLDPIFLYAYNPDLHWKAHHLQSGDTAAYTTASPDPGAGLHEDTLRVLTHDFHASYLVLSTQQSPDLYSYLKQQPKAKKGFEQNGMVVFEVKP